MHEHWTTGQHFREGEFAKGTKMHAVSLHRGPILWLPGEKWYLQGTHNRIDRSCQSLELEPHFHWLLAFGNWGENYPFHSKLFSEISFSPYTFANIQLERSVVLNAQVVLWASFERTLTLWCAVRINVVYEHWGQGLWRKSRFVRTFVLALTS